MKPSYQVYKLCALLMIICNHCFAQKATQKAQVQTLKAKTEMVFIDQADRGEYAASISILEGSLKKNAFIKASDGNNFMYHFQVKEIKVNDQNVNEAKKGDHIFVVLQSHSKAKYFDQGYSLALGSEIDYEKSKVQTKEESPKPKKKEPACSFILNGRFANVQTSVNDVDEPSAMHNQQNKKLTIMLYGDQKDQPRRGMVTIDVLNFTPQKGVINNASFSFVRYKDKAGNMLAEWANSKGKYGSLDITEVASLGKDTYGESFLISGSFEANLPIKMGYESETEIKSIDITKGTFSNVYVQSLFYKK